ncbi:MAG: hypothetical protein IJ929_01785 [Prevotella sp.]|nr:hypothetical protein [Prevotella sp.]
MKKFLLIAIAVLTVGSANAQLSKKQAVGKPQSRSRVMSQVVTKQGKFEVAGMKEGVRAFDKTSKVFKGSVKAKDIKPVVKQFSAARAGAVQALYKGNGTLRSTNEVVQWEMASGTSEGKSVLQNVIPDIFGLENGVIVEYTAVEGGIVIQPQLVASFDDEQAPNGKFYIFMESASTADGTITLSLDAEGHIVGSYEIIYSLYPDATYDFDKWIATYDGIRGAQYSLPGEIVKPVACFESGNLILFAGIGLNGYSYNNNLAITAAYAPTSFANRTADVATGWKWAAYNDGETEEDPDVVVSSGTDRDFSIPFTDNSVKNVTLTAVNETVESEPLIFGVGKMKEADGTASNTACYIYGGGAENWFAYNDGETNAIMTRQDPDGDLKFYTDWGTPDKARNHMSKIYLYHEKPATPLYIEGITIPMVSFTANDDFNLHIKIQKVNYPVGNTKPVLGEIIAEGDATTDNINEGFGIGLKAVEFKNLYVLDENEMSTELNYLFLDDEFVIVIEGWDNGTFSGVLGCQDVPLDNVRSSTWFEMVGEPGTMYAYTTWKTSLLVGFLGATYGYLYTEDSKDIVIDVAGGQASITVVPFYNNAEADETGSKTRLFLDENVADNDIPEWLSVDFANESYSDDAERKFDLVFTAEALPEGVAGRQANLVFMQEGAQLKVTVTQGEASGIALVKADMQSNKAQMFNVAGQRVNKNYKGLVIKNGKKMIKK